MGGATSANALQGGGGSPGLLDGLPTACLEVDEAGGRQVIECRQVQLERLGGLGEYQEHPDAVLWGAEVSGIYHMRADGIAQRLHGQHPGAVELPIEELGDVLHEDGWRPVILGS